jgi:hypothetical protein
MMMMMMMMMMVTMMMMIVMMMMSSSASSSRFGSTWDHCPGDFGQLGIFVRERLWWL